MVSVALMLPPTKIQLPPLASKYEMAARRAEIDSRRKQYEPPVFFLGQVSLKDLRGMLQVSLAGLALLLESVTGKTWTQSQLSKIESGSRRMTEELKDAVYQVISAWMEGKLWTTKTEKAS